MRKTKRSKALARASISETETLTRKTKILTYIFKPTLAPNIS